jgi:hypothetical protein
MHKRQVAHIMSILVINPLEVIRVHHKKRNAAVVAMAAADMVMQVRAKLVAIIEAGQRITRGELEQRFFELHFPFIFKGEAKQSIPDENPVALVQLLRAVGNLAIQFGSVPAAEIFKVALRRFKRLMPVGIDYSRMAPRRHFVINPDLN